MNFVHQRTDGKVRNISCSYALEAICKGDRLLISTAVSFTTVSGVPRGVWFGGSNPPKIPKALQNSVKLNVIVKTVKNC